MPEETISRFDRYVDTDDQEWMVVTIHPPHWTARRKRGLTVSMIPVEGGPLIQCLASELKREGFSRQAA